MHIHYDELYQQKMELIRRIKYNRNDPLWSLVVQIDAVLRNAEDRGEFRYPPADDAPETKRNKIVGRLLLIHELKTYYEKLLDQLKDQSSLFGRDNSTHLQEIKQVIGYTVQDGCLINSSGNEICSTKDKNDMCFVRYLVGAGVDYRRIEMYFPLDDAYGTVLFVTYGN